MTVTLYQVGGSVRDELLGLKSKDVDFTAVVSETSNDPFDHLRSYLQWNGYEIFVETPQYLTIRARFPKDLDRWGSISVKGLTADFVLAREESNYKDGRHPSIVTPGTLESDLRRRDFTVNAMAKDVAGRLIDLYGGQSDLEARILRTVGTPEERFTEDALRALRAVRFAITKGFTLHADVADALRSEWLPPLLAQISVERRREELLRAFKHDSLATLEMLEWMTPEFKQAVFTDGLWLEPSLKG